MNTIKQSMIKHPFISIFIIFPFSFILTSNIFHIIINLILPFIFALWVTGWIYTIIIGDSWKKNIEKPFWFIYNRNYSI